MTAHERSGTRSHEPTGTPESDYRERRYPATRQEGTGHALPNPTNGQSDRLLLTQATCGQAADQNPDADHRHASQASASDVFTRVELHRDRPARTLWLRFGKPAMSMRSARGYRVECYAPGQIFGLARSISATQGNANSSFEVHLACRSSGSSSEPGGCEAGSVILLSVTGWRQVRHVLGVIDAIEALGIDPCNLASEFWEEIQTRLVASQGPGTKVPLL
mgnify:CR=1 FL=1